MGKLKTIDNFFKRKASQTNEASDSAHSHLESPELINNEEPQIKVSRVEKEEIDIGLLERDPGKRVPIWEYPVEERDKIRRAYIKLGPYQPPLTKFPASDGPRPRRFNASWFKKFPDWLEYSPTLDAAFCLPCYLFSDGPRNDRKDAFTVRGFQSWKKVNDGVNCAFLSHVGTAPNSLHNNCVQCCNTLMAQSQHIEKVFHRQNSQAIANNRLRLKTSIEAVRWLTFQACALRGNDESTNSLNRGNFIQLIQLLASYNQNVANVVLENAPGNAQYISPSIQKEILFIFARKVRAVIREEIGDSKFCLIIDEARDESKREQMAIVLRFVDKDGYVKERFFDLVHVSDTSALTLKNEIESVLSRHNLNVENLRGQGYDGASNMRGEWNGLQALFLRDCPYAYYIHCLAHRLQLVLVVAAREVSQVHHFFSKLSLIVSYMTISPKRHDQLRVAQCTHLASQIANNEVETGSGRNQIGTLQRAGDTRWSSHLKSIQSLFVKFVPTCEVLKKNSKEGNYSVRGEAEVALDAMMSFDFIFIFHLMRDILLISHDLCQALQRMDQDILNAMTLVSSTKRLLQKMRECGWENFIKEVTSFCTKHDIDVPDMSDLYIPERGRCRPNVEYVSVEHHYRINLFIGTIDTQMQEMNSRFNDTTMELLTLSSALEPRNSYKSFNVDQICDLAARFYPGDFTEQEKLHLKIQAQHYELDMPHHPDFKEFTSISQVCQGLKKTRKCDTYHLIDRLLCLLLTLPVSSATSERSFSAMNIIKNKLRNKMEDDFLADSLVTYIEKEIAHKFDINSIIDEFYDMKERRAQLR